MYQTEIWILSEPALMILDICSSLLSTHFPFCTFLHETNRKAVCLGKKGCHLTTVLFWGHCPHRGWDRSINRWCALTFAPLACFLSWMLSMVVFFQFYSWVPECQFIHCQLLVELWVDQMYKCWCDRGSHSFPGVKMWKYVKAICLPGDQKVSAWKDGRMMVSLKENCTWMVETSLSGFL